MLDTNECVICGKPFNTPHKVGHYKQKTCSIECRNINHKRVINKWSRKKYALTSSLLTCPICSEQFYGKRGLGVHISWSHPNTPRHCTKCEVLLTEENRRKCGKQIRNTCKSCRNKKQQKYYTANEDVRKRRSDRESKRRENTRKEILTILGNRCNVCGFTDYRALQIDHVRNNGCKERARFGGSANIRYLTYILLQLKKGSKDYQCLCANCNTIKAYEVNNKNDTNYGEVSMDGSPNLPNSQHRKRHRHNKGCSSKREPN